MAGEAVEPVVTQIGMEGVLPLPAVNGTSPFDPVTAPLQTLPGIVLQDRPDGNGAFDLPEVHPAMHDRSPPLRRRRRWADGGAGSTGWPSAAVCSGTGELAPACAQSRNRSCLAVCMWRANWVSLSARAMRFSARKLTPRLRKSRAWGNDFSRSKGVTYTS